MKKLLLVPFLALCQLAAQAQTVTYKPGPAVGEDVDVYTQYGCTTTGAPGPAENYNHDGHPELNFSDWTYNAIGCPHGTLRGLIRFTELNNLSPTAQILDAHLNLFGVASSGSYGNSSYPGSPIGTTNEGWVRRVTSGWTEGGVTWNTQPSATTSNQAPIGVTGAHWNWNTSVDVTDLVRDIRSSCQNEGFQLILQNENYYRQQMYASSDNSDPARWPELVVTYCDPGFTYCSSPLCQYGFTFQPNDPNAPYIQWMVDGTVVYSGPSTPLAYNFPGPGTYKVCLVVKGEKGSCEYCLNVCVRESERLDPCKPGPVSLCDPNFSYCSSMDCPYGFTFQPNDASAPYIQWIVDGTLVYDGPSMPLTYNFPGPGTYQVCLLVKTKRNGDCRYCVNICVAENERRSDCKNCEPGPVKPDEKPEAMMRQAPATPYGKHLIKDDNVFLRVGDVSPNPTRAGWAVTVLAGSSSKSEVAVYDMNGREVVRQVASLATGSNTVNVDARKLPAGSYILRVTTDGIASEPTTLVKY